MTDLVKRLREPPIHPDPWVAHNDCYHLCKEAADYIEQLEEDYSEMCKDNLDQGDRIEQLENELAKAQSDLLAQQHDDATRIEQLEAAIARAKDLCCDLPCYEVITEWANPHNNPSQSDGSNS